MKQIYIFQFQNIQKQKHGRNLEIFPPNWLEKHANIQEKLNKNAN